MFEIVASARTDRPVQIQGQSKQRHIYEREPGTRQHGEHERFQFSSRRLSHALHQFKSEWIESVCLP